MLEFKELDIHLKEMQKTPTITRWAAFEVDKSDPLYVGSLVGYGSSAREAIEDLMQKFEKNGKVGGEK